jgi:hypothetical protein
MMNREFIEKNLSAYLDGQLLPKEMREFERELKQFPDLVAELERLKRLDAIVRGSEIDLPPDGYFDGLAGRIDASIGRESSSRRFSTLWGAVAPKSRLIPILSSVAAVFLVVVVVNHLYQPEVLRKSPTAPTRTIQVKPVEAERDKQLSIPAKAAYQMNIPEEKAELVIGDTVLGKVILPNQGATPAKDKALGTVETKAVGKAKATQSANNAEEVKLDAPHASGVKRLMSSTLTEAESYDSSSPPKPASDDAYYVTARRDLLKISEVPDRPREAETLEAFETRMRAVIFAKAPLPGDVRYEKADQPKAAAASTSTKLEAGRHYAPVTSAKEFRLDSLRQADYSRFEVEQACITATEQPTVFNLINARLYIEWYLSLSEVGDRDDLTARLDSLKALEDVKRKEWHDSVEAMKK